MRLITKGLRYPKPRTSWGSVKQGFRKEEIVIVLLKIEQLKIFKKIHSINKALTLFQIVNFEDLCLMETSTPWCVNQLKITEK